ncbi:MAG: hypothetical protein JWM58_4552 [Rhizobium sp.]|nr:hypothetical protein [Rhizobium sp.]
MTLLLELNIVEGRHSIQADHAMTFVQQPF